MALRRDAGGRKHVPEVIAVGEGALDDGVDMPAYEVAGVAIVGAEHHLVGVLAQYGHQLLVVLGSRAFAYLQHHAGGNALTRLLEGGALMV